MCPKRRRGETVSKEGGAGSAGRAGGFFSLPQLLSLPYVSVACGKTAAVLMAYVFHFARYSIATEPYESAWSVRLAISDMALSPMMPLRAKFVWFLPKRQGIYMGLHQQLSTAGKSRIFNKLTPDCPRSRQC